MSEKQNKPEYQRDVPRSLKGIEVILLYLNQMNNKSVSIRNISKHTDYSMRVVKNILLQLEKFNQVKRVFERDMLQPKWSITSFGKRVLKEAKGLESVKELPSEESELIKNIRIPQNIDKLKVECKSIQIDINSRLKDLQVEVSKMIGPVMNLNNPVFEDLVNFILKRLDYLKMTYSNLTYDPLASYLLKKKDKKERKISKEEEREVFVEIYFLNSLIVNEIKRIREVHTRFSQFMESNSDSSSLSTARELNKEIQTLTILIRSRESSTLDFHVFSKNYLKKLVNNEISTEILEEILEIPLTKEEKLGELKEIILDFHAKVSKGKKKFDNHINEILESIPLYALYQLIKDENPQLNFTIENLEFIINNLSDDGFIPGIKIIQGDQDQYLKVVQLKPRDISEDEKALILQAMKLEVFSLADMISATGWQKEIVQDLLLNLTEIGILRFAKSFLHGERWYIASVWDENKNSKKEY
jgi:hypothetical protein